MTDKEKEYISDLIKQAREGKQLAFSKLYERFKRPLYYVINRIAANKDAADDILSMTFVKAFTKLDSYVDDISFELWLKTIAINTSIDYIRRNKKDSKLYWLDDDENCTIQLKSTADYSPEEDYIFKETDSRLNEAMNRLRYKYRHVLELRTVQNLSYKDISEQLGLSESQVKTLLNTAREKLKQLLN